MREKTLTGKQLDKAYQRGFDARFAHEVTLDANPYPKDRIWERAQWNKGWKAADRDLSLQAAIC